MSNSLESAPLLRGGSRASSYSSSGLGRKDLDSSLLVQANVGRDVDVVVGLLRGHDEDEDIDPKVAQKLRKKLDRHILPLLCLLFTLQGIDKFSLSSVSILGLFKDAHLNRAQFNNIASAFYIGYIIFVWPHSWMMQHFPIGKYIAINVFLWAVFLGLQTVYTSYAGLFTLRFLLGASEGCINTGIMTITTMFYTRLEVAERIGLLAVWNGASLILNSLLAFGISFISETAQPPRWHWFMFVISTLTAITSIAFWVWFPDNPTTARFLSMQEKVDVVNRLRSNQNGIETKVWKKYQFIEALKDPKTWLFFLFSSVATLQGGVGVQMGLIIKDMGFDSMHAALLSSPSGVPLMVSILFAIKLLRRFPNSRGLIAAAGFAPSIVACIFMMTLPSTASAGLLFCLYMMNFSAAGFGTAMSWVAVTTAGHTKKMTVNAMFLIGFALGQIGASQFWKDKYAPRYIIPWFIQMCTYIADICFMLYIWHMFRQENRRRDRIKAETGKVYEEFGYVDAVNPDGTIERFRVPIALLDITDWENEAFRYAL